MRHLRPGILAILFLSTMADAQEYMPYPEARITGEKWTSYHEEVRNRLAGSETNFPQQGLVIYRDPAKRTNYAFTLPGHPAHPAWVTRRTMWDGKSMSLDQIGYFAGDEAAFAKLFHAYEKMNQAIRKEFRSPPNPVGQDRGSDQRR